MISGGYYIKPRCIANSKIANAPPQVREIWDWLIRNAIYSKEKKSGHKLEYGQVLCSVPEIQEALHWMVGYRKQRYKKSACENAMKWLLKEGMITSTKTTRGSIVTICNYSHYQDPKNYESRNQSRNENRNDAGMMPNDSKEGKKVRSKEYNIIRPDDVQITVWDDFIKLRKAKRAAVTETAINGIRREAERAGMTLDAAMQEMCANGWQGFKAEWVNKTKGNSNGKDRTCYSQPTKADRAREALIRSSQALGFAGEPAGSENACKSNLSVFSGVETVREGARGVGEHKPPVSIGFSGLSDSEN